MPAPDRTPALFPTVPRRPAPAPRAAPLPIATRHLWLCVGLPGLALEIHARDIDATQPLAIIDGEDTRSVVHAANAAARHAGVRAGAKLNAAYALCPALQTQPRDPQREAQRLRALADWAVRFTPWVALVEPGALLLEVRGSLGLFGGAEALSAEVEQGLEALHHRCRLALAPTPLSSLWLARAGQRVVVTDARALPGQLASLPLRCLQWPDKTIGALHGIGVRTLGQLMRLPRAGFARRFGKQRLNELDRALGRAPDPRAAHQSPEHFCASLDMPAETGDMALVLAGAQQLVSRLSAFLIARQGSVQGFWLRLFHNDAPATAVRVGMLEHCRDARRLHELLATRLEYVGLPAPVIAIELKSARVVTATACEGDLFRRGVNGDWVQLLENLCARLGRRAVSGLASVPEHRPESAWRYVAPAQTPGNAATAACGVEQRPLWLLPEPQRLQAVDGRPVCDGALRTEHGPERIESGWWDGADVARDYFVACNPQGLRLWIYRERRAPHGWYLHGYFG